MNSSQLDASYRHCVQLAKRSGSNFYFAFLSLPRPMFRDMCALYAFMRITDDLGDDESHEFEQRRVHLQEWKAALDQALQGEPTGLVLPALREVIRQHQIPIAHLHEVISGVESDLTSREFSTFAELEEYCYQVAGAVGLCCLKIWGCPVSEANTQRGIACGTAFQLINILRDLKEDADRQRIYLPQDELDAHGLSGDSISAMQSSTEFQSFMRFQVNRAWDYFERALPLIDDLPAPGRRILSAMFEIYGTLLSKIEQANYDIFSQRIRLSSSQKLRVSLRCLIRMRARIPARPSPTT